MLISPLDLKHFLNLLKQAEVFQVNRQEGKRILPYDPQNVFSLRMLVSRGDFLIFGGTSFIKMKYEVNPLRQTNLYPCEQDNVRFQ